MFCSLGYGFIHILKAPTSPTKKLEEDSLTYLNQGIVVASCFEGRHPIDWANVPSCTVYTFSYEKAELL